MRDTNGSYPLMVACSSTQGSLELVQLLIAHKAKINVQNYGGESPLILAAQHRQDEIIKFLLNNEVDVKLKTKNNDTALTEACSYGASEEIIKSLILLGSEVNGQDSEGSTPLLLACSNKNPKTETISILLKNGADVTIQNMTKDTALGKACEVIDFLNLAFQKKLRVMTKFWITALRRLERNRD